MDRTSKLIFVSTATALTLGGCIFSASHYLRGGTFTGADAPSRPGIREYQSTNCGVVSRELSERNAANAQYNESIEGAEPTPVVTKTHTTTYTTSSGCGISTYCTHEVTTTTTGGGEVPTERQVFDGSTWNAFYYEPGESPHAYEIGGTKPIRADNRWRDAAGEHFFYWVKRQGWELIFPDDPKQLGARVVYLDLETSEAADGSIRPSSYPAVVCELTPAAPRTVVAYDPNAPAPAMTLARTSFAVGDTIEVTFSAPIATPAGEQMWLTIIPADSPDSEFGTWHYVKPGTSTDQVTADAPGVYEIRLHDGYPRLVHHVIARQVVEVR